MSGRFIPQGSSQLQVHHAANTCERLSSPNHKPHSCLSDAFSAGDLLIPHSSSSLPCALPLCSLSTGGVRRPGNERPLCPCLPVLCPMVQWGPVGQEPDCLDPLFAHYSHYLASNQGRTGCWDLSTTHKCPVSSQGRPASAPIRKGVQRG